MSVSPALMELLLSTSMTARVTVTVVVPVVTARKLLPEALNRKLSVRLPVLTSVN